MDCWIQDKRNFPYQKNKIKGSTGLETDSLTHIWKNMWSQMVCNGKMPIFHKCIYIYINICVYIYIYISISISIYIYVISQAFLFQFLILRHLLRRVHDNARFFLFLVGMGGYLNQGLPSCGERLNTGKDLQSVVNIMFINLT